MEGAAVHHRSGQRWRGSFSRIPDRFRFVSVADMDDRCDRSDLDDGDHQRRCRPNPFKKFPQPVRFSVPLDVQPRIDRSRLKLRRNEPQRRVFPTVLGPPHSAWDHGVRIDRRDVCAVFVFKQRGRRAAAKAEQAEPEETEQKETRNGGTRRREESIDGRGVHADATHATGVPRHLRPCFSRKSRR